VTPVPVDQTREQTARLRRAIGRLARQLRVTPAVGGLTPTQLSVLATITRSGPLGLSALAEIERLNPTMLSRVVAGLADQGLVSRTNDPVDRRAGRVAATERGRRLRTRIHDERNDALAAQIVGLSARERAALDAALPVLERLGDGIAAGR
jgi:DNA-binding MarR family transcriptional regulator